jgi:mono/diheme cytochrome c family protein
VFQAVSGDKASGKCEIFADGFAGIEIAATIRVGVMHPKNYRAPMPPMGGAQLKADQVTAVATYVWA